MKKKLLMILIKQWFIFLGLLTLFAPIFIYKGNTEYESLYLVSKNFSTLDEAKSLLKRNHLDAKQALKSDNKTIKEAVMFIYISDVSKNDFRFRERIINLNKNSFVYKFIQNTPSPFKLSVSLGKYNFFYADSNAHSPELIEKHNDFYVDSNALSLVFIMYIMTLVFQLSLAGSKYYLENIKRSSTTLLIVTNKVHYFLISTTVAITLVTLIRPIHSTLTEWIIGYALAIFFIYFTITFIVNYHSKKDTPSTSKVEEINTHKSSFTATPPGKINTLQSSSENLDESVLDYTDSEYETKNSFDKRTFLIAFAIAFAIGIIKYLQ